MKDLPGTAGKIFGAVAEANILVDMIVQNVSKTGITDISCTVHKDDVGKAEAALRPVLPLLGDGVSLEALDGIAKLSVVGIGMRSHSGVAAEMFKALSVAGINIEMISTSEIKITVTVAEDQIDRAANVMHAAFKLAE